MKSSLYNQNLDHYKNEFEKMSLELRILLKPNGEIIDMDENAIRYFSYKETSFINYFSNDTGEEFFRFLQALIEKKKNIHQKFLHNIPGVNKTVLYKGNYIEEDQVVLLVGKTIYKELTNSDEYSLAKHQLILEKERVLKFQETLFPQLDLCLLSIDSSDKVNYCNQPFYDLIGQEALLTGTLIQELDENIHPIIKDIKTVTREIRLTSHSSRHYYYEDESFYDIKGIYFEDDNSILVVIHDHSYQKKFENLLTYKQQMESVTHVAAGVAHELRNPLSVIKGFLQLSSLTNNFPKYYQTIISELDRMNKIIEDFLSVSRKRIEKKYEHPNKIMQSLVYIIRSECLLHDMTFDYYIEKTNHYVHANESMIKQIILNLLRNSIEAFDGIKEKRYLYFNATAKGNEYVVSIEDTGPGMAAEILEQLGKPFFTTKEKGTGVGIPLCKKIIEDHGGTFRIDSEQGVGTKITFTLPMMKNPNE